MSESESIIVVAPMELVPPWQGDRIVALETLRGLATLRPRVYLLHCSVREEELQNMVPENVVLERAQFASFQGSTKLWRILTKRLHRIYSSLNARQTAMGIANYARQVGAGQIHFETSIWIGVAAFLMKMDFCVTLHSYNIESDVLARYDPRDQVGVRRIMYRALDLYVRRSTTAYEFQMMRTLEGCSVSYGDVQRFRKAGVRVEFIPPLCPAWPEIAPPNRTVVRPVEFLFIGSLASSATGGGLAQLLRVLLDCPSDADWRLTLVTTGEDAHIEGLLEDKRIRRLRPEDSLEKYWENCSLFVSPLLQARGTRVKVLEAFKRGVPLLASRESLYGLPPDAADCCLVYDNVDELKLRLTEMFSNGLLLEEKARRGLEYAKSVLSEERSLSLWRHFLGNVKED